MRVLICFRDPFYLAPECFALDLAFKALIAASNSAYESEITDPANAKSCVWSLGIILLELCLVRFESKRENDHLTIYSGSTIVWYPADCSTNVNKCSMFEIKRTKCIGYTPSTEWT